LKTLAVGVRVLVYLGKAKRHSGCRKAQRVFAVGITKGIQFRKIVAKTLHYIIKGEQANSDLHRMAMKTTCVCRKGKEEKK